MVMTDHTSKHYEGALEHAREMFNRMGARVERQLADAIECLHTGSPALIAQIMRHEAEVNSLERAIDDFTRQIIARRQPAARDLRLLMALLGATTDLERAGDESKKIALYARSIFAAGRPLLARVGELWPLAHLVRNMLHEALVGIEALDPRSAAALMRRDLEANEGFRSVLRRLARIMVEDPRTISSCLDMLFVAKSLERIGDHAKNIGEHVVFAAMGKDVRHTSVQELERLVQR